MHAVRLCCIAVALAAVTHGTRGQGIVVTSFGRNGELTWTNDTTHMTCRVEWASEAAGPWTNTWEGLGAVETGTNLFTTVNVPMFYRVVSPAVARVFELVNAVDAGNLIRANRGNDSFAILDVRRYDTEYLNGHVVGTANIDFYRLTFNTILNHLDRQKTYLVHCASGNRSGQVVDRMRTNGFLRVYDLEGGFGAFNIGANMDLVE